MRPLGESVESQGWEQPPASSQPSAQGPHRRSESKVGMGGPASDTPPSAPASRKQGPRDNRKQCRGKPQSLPPISRPNPEEAWPTVAGLPGRPCAWHAVGALEVSALHSEGLGVKAMAGEALGVPSCGALLCHLRMCVCEQLRGP